MNNVSFQQRVSFRTLWKAWLHCNSQFDDEASDVMRLKRCVRVFRYSHELMILTSSCKLVDGKRRQNKRQKAAPVPHRAHCAASQNIPEEPSEWTGLSRSLFSLWGLLQATLWSSSFKANGFYKISGVAGCRILCICKSQLVISIYQTHSPSSKWPHI